MRIGDLIRDEARSIAADWAANAREQVPADTAMPPLVLVDHIPDLLAKLGDWLVSHGTADERAVWDMAHRHAMDRLDLNFELREVVHEYRVLRRVLYDRIVAAEPGNARMDEMGRVDEAIDSAVAEAVDRFSREHERQRLSDAERTVEFRERFIGIVSHDLRNPLNTIITGAALIRRWDGLPGEVASVAERVLANAERMARMITELLDLTRGRLEGGILVSPETTDLSAVAATVREDIEATHPGRSIEWRSEGDLRGHWDPDRLGQILGNLVLNALEHGDPGTPVRVRLLDQGDEVAICVHNQGKPIRPEELPHVFDAFRRTRKATGAHGLGLGLFIASEIAHAHGGRIEVTSSAGDGTVFQVMLPRSPPSVVPGAG